MMEQQTSKTIRSLYKTVFASLPIQYKIATILRKVLAEDLDFYKKNWIQLYKDEAKKQGFEVSNKSATITINNIIKRAMTMVKGMSTVVDLIQEALIPILKYHWFKPENLTDVKDEDDLSKLFQNAVLQKMLAIKENVNRMKHRQPEHTVSITNEADEDYNVGQISEETLTQKKEYPMLSQTTSWSEFKNILLNELAKHSTSSYPLDKIFDLYYFHNLSQDEIAEKLFADNDTDEIVAPASIGFQLEKAEKITKKFIKTHQGQQFLDKLHIETGINL
jgi:hypothetical protein